MLEGADSIAAAISCRVYARLSRERAERGIDSLPLQASRARAAAERMAGETPLHLSVDVSELRHTGKKLGLGSSSAVSTAAAAAVFAYQGKDLNDGQVRDKIMEVALASHRTVVPHGAGADVAAATLGGAICFRQQGEAFEMRPVAWPAELKIRAVWTGAEADTGDLIRQVRELAKRDAPGYRELIASLSATARDCQEALLKRDNGAMLRALDEYGRGMEALGRAAHAPVFTAELRRIAQLARESGGAAKPSGAGGGDVAVALFADDEDARRFVARCREENFHMLGCRLDTQGVRVELMSK
jgi:phosphomevalonate kinase